MRTVFSDVSTIAHIWANQSQSEAKNPSRNFYFDGVTIYSYGRHFPIAKHVTNEAGESAVLFTVQSYSNTTSKHVAIVKQACRHKNIIYCYSPESTHTENFNSWAEAAESVAANLMTARKPEKYLSQIEAIKQTAEKYANFWSIAIPEKLSAVLSISNKIEFTTYRENKAAILAAEEKRRAAEAKKSHDKALKKWLSGKTYRLYLHNGRDYLRLTEAEGRQFVETSQGVKIPKSEAAAMYKAILSGANSGAIRTNSGEYKYHVNGGDIKAGCHTFPITYIKKFGANL